MDDYTRPERSAEFARARRIRARVLAAGGCAMCLHRVQGWGLSACSRPNRRFPMCMKDRASPAFELDESTVEGGEHG